MLCVVGLSWPSIFLRHVAAEKVSSRMGKYQGACGNGMLSDGAVMNKLSWGRQTLGCYLKLSRTMTAP